MIYEDSITISLLPALDAAMPKEESLYERNQRMANEIMDDEWRKLGDPNALNIREYVRACELRFRKDGLPYNYNERDDEHLDDNDIVGTCFNCGKEITAGDMRHVRAISYSWEHKDGTPVIARCCWSNNECHDVLKDPVWKCEYEWLRAHYLRLCGLTETEYRERLKKEQHTLYAARVASGYYKEEE